MSVIVKNMYVNKKGTNPTFSIASMVLMTSVLSTMSLLDSLFRSRFLSRYASAFSASSSASRSHDWIRFLNCGAACGCAFWPVPPGVEGDLGDSSLLESGGEDL